MVIAERGLRIADSVEKALGEGSCGIRNPQSTIRNHQGLSDSLEEMDPSNCQNKP